MCCTGNIQRCQCQDRSFHWNHGHAHCGCGCMGKAQTIARLEEIKSGLKAELECIENRLVRLRTE